MYREEASWLTGDQREKVDPRPADRAAGKVIELEGIQEIEDELDAQAVREALEEARAGKARPWLEVRASLRCRPAE